MLRARDVMTPDVVTVGPNDRLAVANDVMRLGRIRHMPVVDEDEGILGVVSQRDLFHNALIRALGFGTHAQQNALEAYRVKDAMSSPPVTVAPDAPVADVAQLMLDRKIGCVLVVEGQRLRGIITEGDFVALAARGEPAK